MGGTRKTALHHYTSNPEIAVITFNNQVGGVSPVYFYPGTYNKIPS
ncbi:hypothetical protein BJP36_40865 [Moorena producens JHB]|uniref:Uncharacterized protein n=1 Tax=Moorena producens (strain JHB) TaxID=1454205 RepID=A0A9Q9UVD5_MOOP1|nr:hypothetical protein BJP36_40865 [Moorena producens JHB]